MRTFTLQSLLSKRMVHIVRNKQEQLSSVCFPYFSLCLTFLRLLLISELPTAVSDRRSYFTVLHYGAGQKKENVRNRNDLTED